MPSVERFRGSPTVLINGVDPFADDSTPFGFGCRLYRTSMEADVAPDIASLRRALKEAADSTTLTSGEKP